MGGNTICLGLKHLQYYQFIIGNVFSFSSAIFTENAKQKPADKQQKLSLSVGCESEMTDLETAGICIEEIVFSYNGVQQGYIICVMLNTRLDGLYFIS